MITNVRKTALCICFHGKFANMRKLQDFVIYPVSKGSNYISIQSDGRFGQIFKDGSILITSKNTNYPNHHTLQYEYSTGIIKKDTATETEMAEIRNILHSTTLGNSVCSISGNDGANEW